MKLKKLLAKIKNSLPKTLLSKEVSVIKFDPEKVTSGDVFLLLNDKSGVSKIKRALKNGAICALAEREYDIENCYMIENPRRAFALMEKRLHKCACDKMKLIGVTGTNGKTTTTNMIYHILRGAGKRVGIIGSLGYKIDGDWIETGFTTPDPDILHEIFQKMKNEKVEYVVMEVSAHAIALEKIAGLSFEVGVLTNITQDHLDFFGSMENYAQTKFKFFNNGYCSSAVVCADSVDLNEFSKVSHIPFASYGVKIPSDVFGAIISQSLVDSEFFCCVGDKTVRAEIPFVGEYNVQNSLAAIATCVMVGIGLLSIISSLKNLPPIDGRFNVIECLGKTVIIDFAHTPDGLEKIISTVKTFADGRILTIFGCGGDRDAIKRPIMGKISTTLSDISFFTSDNPRFEDPKSIVEQIAAGAVNGNFVCEIDRKKAIKSALNEAQDGDVVIIAGKGTEKYQDICGVKIPYDDYSQVIGFIAENKK